MKWNQIETGWKSYSANAKQRWSKLTDEQIAAMQGKHQALAAGVQQAYGISKEESEKQISDWQSRQIDVAPAANQPAKQPAK